MVARVVNQRRTGVRDERNVLPLFELRHQRFCFLLLIMIVQGEETSVNRKVLQQ